MKWLEFIEKLNELGININSTNIENQEKVYDISSVLDISFGDETKIVVKNLKVKFIGIRKYEDPLPDFIKHVIDLDGWKYSQHENIGDIEGIKEIIQNKILNRAKDIEKMMALLMILNKTQSIYQ